MFVMPINNPDKDVSEARAQLRATTDLIGKGVRNPEQIPTFVLGTLFPKSRWGPEWRQKNGFITFDDGGFAGGNPTRPELSARIYREVHQLDRLLPEEAYDRSLEVGCGYGRLSGWITDYAGESVAIEPNTDAIEQARLLYPDSTFVKTVGETLPFGDDSFDLIVSWGVLQHIPPDSIDMVGNELVRVLDDGGTLLVCERTSGDPGRASWPRSKQEYQSLFHPCDLVAYEDRATEPTFSYAEYSETMAFSNGHSHTESSKDRA